MCTIHEIISKLRETKGIRIRLQNNEDNKKKEHNRVASVIL